ncbi:hypothetical protein GWI33_005196 [Rhynchophorus ferrugineus]|uniref:Uncharacterized protein n=1 Tax=Rhynchophorus ferrugineus TaxID=354439 RepID=A0A834IJM9_RHYFE|nr:hypothetical protein GWI33_005196 [Rhynchophorus ferrugineus]
MDRRSILSCIVRHTTLVAKNRRRPWWGGRIGAGGAPAVCDLPNVLATPLRPECGDSGRRNRTYRARVSRISHIELLPTSSPSTLYRSAILSSTATLALVPEKFFIHSRFFVAYNFFNQYIRKGKAHLSIKRFTLFF